MLMKTDTVMCIALPITDWDTLHLHPETDPTDAKTTATQNIIPAELREQGKTHIQVCEALNELGFRTRTGKLWRHPQQIVKLLRSFES